MTVAVRKRALPVGAAEPISLAAHRPRRRRVQRKVLKLTAVCAILFLGILGSFADSAIARSGLLLFGAGEDAAGNLDGVATTLIWATIANVAVSIGIIAIGVALLSRPSAEVVELRPRWRRKR